MSKVQIKGNVSGTGTVTLESPNTNSDSTITLPSAGGTLLTTASTGLNANNITTGILAAAQGGTGVNTLTSEAVIIGNATSAVKFVSPGTSGNALTSNGTAWVSQALPASNNASALTTGIVGVNVGGTGANTLTANAVIIGNTTSAVKFVSPGTSGNVLSSNGTAWISQAISASGMSLVASADFAAGSTECDITNIPTTTGLYLLVYRVNFNNENSAQGLSLRCSTNNGSSFYSGAGEYMGTAGGTLINFSVGGSTNAKYGQILGYGYIYQPPNSANINWSINGFSAYSQYDTAGVGGLGTTVGFGSLLASTAPVDAIKIFRASGITKTFNSGYIRIYKLAMS